MMKRKSSVLLLHLLHLLPGQMNSERFLLEDKDRLRGCCVFVYVCPCVCASLPSSSSSSRLPPPLLR